MSDNFDLKYLPKHIGIIMDGNRRFARQRFMPAEYGHMSGANNFIDITEYCSQIGLQAVTFYAFSTENFNRSKEEKDHLIRIVESVFGIFEKLINRLNIKVRFLGDRSVFSKKWVEKMNAMESNTLDNSGMRLNVALNYGGRPEIIRAAKLIFEEISNGNIKLDDVDAGLFESFLYTSGLPHVDMIIRTGGEMRLSNFLLWQCAYSELFFVEKYWPEYNRKDLENNIIEFQKRVRNFGK